jgi:hypothetical protein
MYNFKFTLSFFLLLVLSYQLSAQTLCQNPTNGGSIMGEQTICANTSPSTIINVNFPSGGGTGTLEYIWIKWNVLPQSAPQDFTMLPGTNTASLDPGPLTETTWFRRCSRREGCDDYIAETNVVKVTVLDFIDPVFTLTQPSCTNFYGSLQITNLPAGYSSSIDNEPLTADKTNYTNIAPGIHTLTVLRPLCGVKTVSFTINEPINTTPTPIFTVTQPEGSVKGSVTLSNLPSGYYSQLDYGTRNIDQASYGELESGLHNLIIGLDGCEDTASFSIVALNICEQLTTGGAAYPNQTICYGSTAGTITGDDLSNNGTLQVEYRWVYQTTDPVDGDNYSEVSNSNSISVEPGALCGTFWYKRFARTISCTEWNYESNWVKVGITTESTIRFVNNGECAVNIYWLNGTEEILYKTLEGGSSYDQATYQGHTFRAKSVTTGLSILVVTANGCDINTANVTTPCVAYTNDCGANITSFDTQKTYRIVNKHTGMSLEVQYASTAENAYITQNWTSTRTRQMWNFEDAGSGYYKIKNRATGKYFQINGASLSAGATLRQGSDNGGENQEFSFEIASGTSGFYKIIAHHSCLPIKLTSSTQVVGGRVYQYNWQEYYEHGKWAIVEVVNPPSLSSQESTFTANKKDNDVKLDWVVKSSEPVKYYIIDRSADNNTFTSIEKIDNLNSSEEIQHFTTLDKSPLKANNYYRLRTIFANGTESITESELVVMPSALNLVIFPNPSTEKAFVDLTEWQDKTNIQIEIFDQTGVVVSTQSVANTHDELFEINLKDLNNGAYSVLISAKNTRPISQLLIVEKLD